MKPSEYYEIGRRADPPIVSPGRLILRSQYSDWVEYCRKLSLTSEELPKEDVSMPARVQSQIGVGPVRPRWRKTL